MQPQIELRSKPLLITGVAGFIGRYLARHFTQAKWSVIGVDNSAPENAPTDSLVGYQRLNLPSPQFSELLTQYQPQVCIHCAGRASVDLSMSEPDADFYGNVTLTFEVLNALRLYAPTCRFIFLSSAAVYGNPQSLPVLETDPVSPISPYGFHKFQSEQLCLEFSKIYNLPTASARIFSAYGPGLRRQVMWDICKKSIMQKSLSLRGTGKETRDFIHVLDIARSLDVILRNAPMTGEVYNLGSAQEVSIQELANLFLETLEYGFVPTFDGLISKGNPLNWCSDISRLKNLGYSSTVPLEQGVKAFVRWCKAELENI